MNTALAWRVIHYGGFFVPTTYKDYGKHLIKWEVFSERILENPLVLQHLPSKKSKILDVGSRYSQLPLEFAALGHETVALDIEEYVFHHKNLTFVQEDIRKTSFADNTFDVVTVVSTLEHVGLGDESYGDTKNVQGDIAAMKEISRILKPRGYVLLTIPFGKPAQLPFMRIYDKKRVAKISKYFKIDTELYMHKDGNSWEVCTYDMVHDIEQTTNHTRSNAFFKLRNNK